MQVVVISASPEGKEVVKTPWEFIAAVSIDGLEETKHNPDVHGKDVQITRKCAPNNGTSNSAKSKNHDFDGRSILSS